MSLRGRSTAGSAGSRATAPRRRGPEPRWPRERPARTGAPRGLVPARRSTVRRRDLRRRPDRRASWPPSSLRPRQDPAGGLLELDALVGSGRQVAVPRPLEQVGGVVERCGHVRQDAGDVVGVLPRGPAGNRRQNPGSRRACRPDPDTGPASPPASALRPRASRRRRATPRPAGRPPRPRRRRHRRRCGRHAAGDGRTEPARNTARPSRATMRSQPMMVPSRPRVERSRWLWGRSPAVEVEQIAEPVEEALDQAPLRAGTPVGPAPRLRSPGAVSGSVWTGPATIASIIRSYRTAVTGAGQAASWPARGRGPRP